MKQPRTKTGMRGLPPFQYCRNAVCATVALVLLLSGCTKEEVASRELAEPLLAQQQVADAKSLYFTLPVAPDQRDERASMFAQAARDPRFWRQLDRRFRFDALLLVGDPAVYRPLVNHLKQSPDWVLSYLDHAALVYRRAPAQAWDPEALNGTAERFAAPKAKAVFYIQAAGRLLAVGNTGLADELLQKAKALDESTPELWTQLANLRIHMSQWKEGLQHAERALGIRPDYGPALSIKAQLLLAAKRPGEAYECTGRLVAAQPNDPGALFLHARMAHAAKAYRSEIEALKKLVDLAQREKQSVTGYRLYLGQAYAADGQAQPALAEFKRVLEAGDASEEQRQFASQLLEQISQRSR